MKKLVIYYLILCFVILPSCLSKASENMLDSEVIKEFNHIYMESITKNDSSLLASSFLGVILIQNPADMWIMQELITKIRPDFVIETGTLFGGSALYFATILKQVNNKGKVITIDIKPKVNFSMNRLKTIPKLYKTVKNIFDNYIEIVQINSVDPELIKWLKERTKNKKVLVTLDSCHSYEHVLKELNLYSELVSPGSYLIVQDTFLDDKEEWLEKYAKCSGYTKSGGPRKAMREFLRKNHDFIVDTSCERFFFTSFPSGYLKKVIKK